MKIRPPIKIHGGKHYVAPWILEHFPDNYEQYDYVEPFVGGGSVLLNKTPSIGVEAINDIHLGIVQIFKALRDEPTQFIGRLKRIRYTENTFNRMASKKIGHDVLDLAIKEFVLRRMSRGGLKTSFAWSERKRGGKPGDVNAWNTILDQLPIISERLQGVYVFNKPASEVIHAFDEKTVLMYVDPPYLHETRVSTQAYEHEMTTEEHISLAELLNKHKGKILLSGYMSPLYRRLYKNWKCYKKKVPNNASQQKVKEIKTECLWCNY